MSKGDLAFTLDIRVINVHYDSKRHRMVFSVGKEAIFETSKAKGLELVRFIESVQSGSSECVVKQL